jgi:iron complex outermembrane receptor protein
VAASGGPRQGLVRAPPAELERQTSVEEVTMSLKRLLRIALLLAFAPTLLPALAWAQGSGQVAGTITGANGAPLSGVTVVINEMSMAAVTDDNGRFVLTGIPPGSYTVTLTMAENTQDVSVDVAAGQVAQVNQKVDWDVSYAETITVYSASRKRERIVEAPAAVTVISEQELERESSHGQLAKVLEFTPGVELTQSGLYDFNVNTRGFNSSLNRRVPALIDGRDPSVPFLMSTDWPSMSAMGDVASVELVRGPSSALYGVNAYNGVLNLTTKQPRYSQGGTVKLTGGELSTYRGDMRWAGALSENNYLKVTGSYTQSDDFYRARTAASGVEYTHFCSAAEANSPDRNCFQRPELVAPARFDDELWQAGLRYDHYFGETFATIEGGTSYGAGPLIQTGIGRVQILEQNRPWGRFNVSSQHWDLLAYYNKRDAPRQTALASGANLVLDERNWAGEVQGNMAFAGTKGQLIGGMSYRDEDIDTRNDAGVSTLTAFNPVGTQRKAVYGQLEYSFTGKFKAVVAGRWDDTGLQDSQISPKLALVYSPTGSQTVRVSYNKAFQAPNYSEQFLAAPGGAPITGFAPLNAAVLGATGVNLGLGLIQVRANGNPNLDVEEIETYEVGYSGILGSKAYLTLDYYNSKLDNFVTDLLPGVNPTYPQYLAPASIGPVLGATVNATLRAGLGANYVGLTTVNGQPTLVVSYANAGRADTQGVEFGLNYYVTDHWTWGLNYNWFDFEIKEKNERDLLLPNSPENQASSTLAYVGDRWDFSVGYRWVDGFRWAVGPFVGDVPTYEVADVGANFRITPRVAVGLNVSNVLDNDHWESFGGDLVGRRALGNVTFSW